METGGDTREQDGTVVRSTGSWYEVQLEDRVVPSKVRGRFRLRDEDVNNPVIVGDAVRIRLNDDGTGLITDLYPRRNQLVRRAAGRKVGQAHILVTNVDRAWAVMSVKSPRFNPGFLDRFLVMAGRMDIPAGIVINKVDLLREDDLEALAFWRDLYAEMGYPVLPTSAVTGEGIEDLRGWLQGQTNAFSGLSGTGKSSVLNAVEPSLHLRTGQVSERTNKGQHTTTNATLYPLSFGGFVVDTPGLREFGVIDLEAADLGHYFIEFGPYLHQCRFPTCTHDHEPGCAVKEALEAETITEERYLSYLNILHSIRLGDEDVGR
jgi:ribosome biogenesis GTPase